MHPTTVSEAISYLTSKDVRLYQLIETMAPPPVDSSGDVYYDLLSCIIDQQIHYRSKSTAFWRFLDLFSGGYPHPQQLLSLPEEAVLELKVSGRKYQHIRSVATWWQHEGGAQIDWTELSDEAIRRQLASVPGVGTWTTDMVLLFTLQRPNIFPADDYGLKKAMCAQYGLTSEGKALKTDMERIAQAWVPYRSLACRYLWASTQVRKTSQSL